MAEAANVLTGKRELNAIQPNAGEQGRIAALNMAGRPVRFKGGFVFNVLTTLGLASSSFGEWEGVPGGESAEALDESRYRYLNLQFDGDRLTYRRHGSELTMVGGRGLCEPSLARLGDRYFLTLRNDARGYVTTSDNGIDFQPIKPWTFDDGTELGSYNTQQHWLVHSDGLILAYTRRGAANDHIVRHRAPLFLAQVDPDRQVVVRRTEKVLIPERGEMLGNFGASAIDAHQWWVTDAEYLIAAKPHPRGADGTVWAAKVAWSRPNA